MKDIVLKLIQWRTWVPIVIALVLGWGIYKGIIGFDDLLKWFQQILDKVNIDIDLNANT